MDFRLDQKFSSSFGIDKLWSELLEMWILKQFCPFFS